MTDQGFNENVITVPEAVNEFIGMLPPDINVIRKDFDGEASANIELAITQDDTRSYLGMSPVRQVRDSWDWLMRRAQTKEQTLAGKYAYTDASRISSLEPRDTSEGEDNLYNVVNDAVATIFEDELGYKPTPASAGEIWYVRGDMTAFAVANGITLEGGFYEPMFIIQVIIEKA